MAATHHSSLRMRSFPTGNNSDDEEDNSQLTAAAAAAASAASDASSYKLDFTSFPTLADPEQENGKTLSNMITSTLRKVTNNASNLVHTYSKLSDTSHNTIPDMHPSPRQPHTVHERDNILTNPDTTLSSSGKRKIHSSAQEDERAGHQRRHHTHYNIPTLDTTVVVPIRNTNEIQTIQSDYGSDQRGVFDGDQDLVSIGVRRHGAPDGMENVPGTSNSATAGGIGPSPMIISGPASGSGSNGNGVGVGSVPGGSVGGAADMKSLHSFMSTTSINTERSATVTPPPMSAASASSHQLPSQHPKHPVYPQRVRSNSKGLSLSTLSIPKLQPTSTTTNALININALATTDTLRSTAAASPKPQSSKASSIITQPKSQSSSHSQPSQREAGENSHLSLQNRISSIFNNLPNDIELSDDSASDTETIDADSASPHKNSQSKRSSPRNKSRSDSNHSRSKTAGNVNPTSSFLVTAPTSSTTSASSSRNVSAHASKKNSQTQLSSVFDNAKSLLNSGITNVTSSSNSIMSGSTEKKSKKKKPKKTSDNPLKNGGIPRFYWMNDSFVSDCLNCFKPFTAFRRKHHCRFCGQIFCNDCTMFISYSQHKEERRQERATGSKPSLRAKRNYSDKLRVCKPCYSDVIVYLSDDSSSSSSSEEHSDNEVETSSYVKSSTPVAQTFPEVEGAESLHPLSRIRSQSMNSRRDSLINDSIINANKGFLSAANKTPTTIATGNDLLDSNWSPSKQKRIPNTGSLTPEVLNLKPLPNQQLQMAIPTTRKGESVEIPVPMGSYSSTVLNPNGSSPALINSSNVAGGLSATPTNISATINNKAWNYSYLRNNITHLSHPDINKSHSLENLSHMYSHFMKKKSNSKLGNGGDQNGESRLLKNDEAGYDSDKSFDDADVESDNEDEQVMSLYTSLNHHNGLVTSANGVPVGSVGGASTLSPRAVTNQYKPSSNLSGIVVPTLGEFPSMMGADDKAFSRRKQQIEEKSGTPSKLDAGDSVLSKLFHNYQSSPKDDSTISEGKSVSFLDDKPKSDSLRSHERAHASLLRMRSRRKSKSARNVSLLTQQNMNNNIGGSNNASSTNNNGSSGPKFPTIDTSFNTFKSSTSPMSTPNSPTPNFNSSTSLTQVKSYDVPATNSSLNLFSPDQVSSSSAMKRNTSMDDIPVTPTFTRTSRTSGEFDSELLLDDSIYRYQPHDDTEVEVFEGTGNNGAIVHFESPYRTNYEIYTEFLDRIFCQYLNDFGIVENKERWTKTVRSLFEYIDYLKITDTLDTKQYIKIKRLLGGEIEDSNVIDGIFWTKNIDSKKMMSTIDNPKIALLMFPIEYLKQKEQFISLRIVHSQQNVYITNLVSRLVSLKPDVIIVGDTVCGLAEKLLEEAGITVVSNTKPQVIERISRYTKADIFQSVNDLFFKKGSLGTCKKMEVKKYLYQNTIKSFIFLTGSDISSGFTITLRGGDAMTLRIVKNSTEDTIPARLNAKFERSLFEDQYLIFRDYDYKTKEIVQILDDLRGIKELYENDEEKKKEHLRLRAEEEEDDGNALAKVTQTGDEVKNDIQALSTVDKDVSLIREKEVADLLTYNSEICRFVSQFNDRIITTSPAVKLLLPTPLTNLAESYKALAIFYFKYKQIRDAQTIEDLDDPDLLKDKFFSLNIDLDKLPNREADLLKILKYRSSIYLKSLRINFQSRSRLWANCVNTIPLDPQRRNNIYVLNSTVSIKHATPCYGPVLVVTDNYTENDLCLGLFLDKIFTEARKNCNECGDSYLNHYRTYSHGNGKLDMVLEQIGENISTSISNSSGLGHGNADVPPSDDPSKRFMWSYCTICNSATPVVNMSHDTYYLSIGKFFELCFWGTGIIINSHECGHDFFKHHVRYFGYNDLAIKMVYSPIDTYEVVVPKKQLEYSPDIDIQLKVETLDLIKMKSHKFFSSISNRLNRVKVDTIDEVEDGLHKVEELKTKLDQQIETIETKTMEIYNSTLTSHHLPLNSILRDLQELGVIWDNEFVEFEKNFLPSENEITRLTQFHLKKFLMDKYSDEEKKRKDDKELKEKETKTQEEVIVDTASQDNENEKQSNLEENEKVGEVEKDADTKKSSDTDAEFDNPNSDGRIPIPGVENTGDTSERPKPKGNETIRASPELRMEIGKMVPSTLLTVNNPSASVMEKIHKMEALLENERLNSPMLSPTKLQASSSRKMSNLPPKSPLKKLSLSHKSSEASLDKERDKDKDKDGTGTGATNSPSMFLPILNSSNKVHHLANFFDQLHFDQISAEFKKQRERELEKKLNRYKAFPIVASKPIVEIYNKIEDAVDVEEKGGEPKKDKNGNIDSNATDSGTPLAKSPSLNSKDTNDGTENASNAQNSTNASNNNLTLGKPLTSDIPQPEKNSLLKSLTNFWADRSATLWDPLDYPLGSSEHTFADSDVIVREDEPSSLIAFCLSSTDYKQKIQSVTVEDQNGAGSGIGSTGVTVISNAINSKKAAQFAKIEKKFKKNNSSTPGELENIMNKFSTTHLKYQYLDGQTNLSCKIFYSEQFEAFRKACGNEDSFIQSLSRCVKWDSSGGKSGSSFLKTLDNRYILKELSKSELESFVAIAPFYFKYMSQSMFNTLTTAIAKIFGFYQIHIKNPITGKNFKMDFLIMENLFYNKKTTRIFDLKGSMRNRHVQQTGKENEVLLDENMIEYIYESPVFVREHSKKLLRGSLFNDTAFLSAMDVMDYSLIIGIVDEGEEDERENSNKKLLYVGIIDCIRTFTWDKKVENWVKGTNLIGGKKGKDPTIVTPKQYRTRFREAMERYILEVPDCWYNI